MKRNYNGLSFSLVLASTASPILVGSKTTTPIEIANVDVKEYEQGFDIGGNDFKDISFD